MWTAGTGLKLLCRVAPGELARAAWLLATKGKQEAVRRCQEVAALQALHTHSLAARSSAFSPRSSSQMWHGFSEACEKLAAALRLNCNELFWHLKKIGINPLALTSQHHFSFYLSTTYQQATLSKSKMLVKKRKSKFRKWWLSQRYRLGRRVPSSSLQKKQNQCQRPWPGWPIVAQLFTLVSYASTCRNQPSICGIQFLFT